MPGLSDEFLLIQLDKLAVSKGLLRVSQSRKGRRPMSVTTFLRKERDGSLYKDHVVGRVAEQGTAKHV